MTGGETLRSWALAFGAMVVGLGLVVTLWRPGDGAPDFTLPDLSGGSVTLSDHEGDVVVLNFWFTSCGPCRAEIPVLSKFARTHPDVRLYGISVDTMPEDRLAVAARQLGVDYPVLMDRGARVARQYGVRAYPTTVVVRGTTVVDTFVGAIRRGQLDAMITGAEALPPDEPFVPDPDDRFEGYGTVGEDGVYRRRRRSEAREEPNGWIPLIAAGMVGGLVVLIGGVVAFRMWPSTPEEEI